MIVRCKYIVSRLSKIVRFEKVVGFYEVNECDVVKLLGWLVRLVNNYKGVDLLG